MAAGYGSVLNLPAPAPPPGAIPKLGEPGQRATRTTFEDRSRRFRAADVTYATIQSAIDRANQTGDMSALADVNGLMLKSPIYGGVHAQRVSGSKRLILGALSPKGVKLKDGSTLRVVLRPGSATPRGEAIAESTRLALTDQDASVGDLATQAITAKLTFGGLTEIVWRQDGTKPAGAQWTWTEFIPATGQRIRFDKTTGEIGYALRPSDQRGIPVSAYEPGTWAAWTPDTGNPMFAARGVLPMLHTDWFHMTPIGGMWVQAIERFASPAIDVATDDIKDRTKAEEMGETLGSQSVFTHAKETTVQYLTSPAAQKGTGTGPHGEFEQRCKTRAAIAFCGAEQTVTVSQGQGSQQSAGGQENVREDILLDDLDFFVRGLVRYVLTAFATLNYGPDAADDAARYEYQIEQPLDALRVIEETKAAEEIGIDRDVDEIRKLLGWREPAPGRSVREIRQARGGGEAKSNLLTGSFVKGKP